jgi:hypothetical protein
MLHPRGPPAGDPATQTAGGLVRLSSVEAASAAITALNERPSLTGPGGPPLLVRKCVVCCVAGSAPGVGTCSRALISAACIVTFKCLPVPFTSKWLLVQGQLPLVHLCS